MKNKLILASSLLALAVGSAWSNSFFYFNQVGYDAGKPISIIVKSDSELEGAEFKLMSSGNAVHTGKLSKGTNPDNWVNNGKFYVATLERGVAAGSYTLQITENGQPVNSGEFKVAENALATATLGAVLDYFYDDRAVNSTIVGWDSKLPVYNGGGKTLDVHGGWYDASGDVSKYLSHLSYANYLNPQQIPLTAWVLAHTAEHIPTLLGKTSTKAKTAEEAAFGADFLVRMLDEQGFFYMTVFDGWGSPLASREICAFTGEDGKKTTDYQTAFREGGGMAIAALARVSMLRVNGDFTSEQYLEAAKKGYAHLSEKQSIGGNCAYCDDGKENIIDDYTALLAATELYAATGEDKYKTDADKRAALSHCTGGCSSTVDVNDAVKKHYNWLLSITNKVDNPFGYARQTFKTGGNIKDGFFIPHDNESNYWWQGEDARLASLAAAAVYAFNALDLDGSEGVDKYATDQLDWILGKNPYATCMMYGFGTKVPEKYDGQSDFDATLKGGIANGITSKNSDGSGIAWDDDGVTAVGFPYDEPWNNWRWVEQWLPHSTWYLMALATRYDEKGVSILPKTSVPHKAVASAGVLNVRLQGRLLSIDASGAQADADVSIVGMNGAKVASGALHDGRATVSLESVKSGIYMVKVAGLGARKIVVR